MFILPLLALAQAQSPQPPDFGTPHSPFTPVISVLFFEDLDGDGVREFLGADGTIYVMDEAHVSSTLNILDHWDYRYTHYRNRYLRWTKLVDVDGDGLLDIFNPSSSEYAPALLSFNQGGFAFDETDMPPEWDDFDRGGAALDLDLDGDIDFLHLTNKQITWTENLGSRTFAYRGILTPHLIADDLNFSDPIDLDGDGHQDLYAWGAAEVVFFIKPGGLNQVVISDDDTWSTGATAADVNQDGLVDLVFGFNNSKDKLYLQEPNQVFSWDSIALDTLNRDTYDVAFTDVDGDMHQDLVIARRYKDRIYRNDGNGQFTEIPDAIPNDNQATTTLLSGDFDLDGDVDMLRGMYNRTQIISWNNGSGNFHSADRSKRGNDFTESGAICGDWDADGDIDIWALRRHEGYDELWRNDGTGTFQIEELPLVATHEEMTNLIRIDWNEDGMDDIIALEDWDRLVLYIQDPPGQFSQRNDLFPELLNYVPAFGATDLDLDGDPDVYLQHNTIGQPDEFHIWENLGSGQFALTTTSITLQSRHATFTAIEINGDQLPEILINYTYPSHSFEVWNNAGSFQFQADPSLVEAAPEQTSRMLLPGDLDGDGWEDLVFTIGDREPQEWFVGVFWNESGKLVQSKEFHFPTIADDWYSTWSTWNMIMDDFNLDGQPDLFLLSDYSSNTNRLMINLGNREFGLDRNPRKYLHLDTRVVASADFDTDGDSDLFVGNGDSFVFHNRTYHLAHISPPVPGREVDIDIRGLHGTPWTLLVGTRPTQIEIPGSGYLRVAPDSILGTASGVTDENHQSITNISLPATVTLGRTLYLQCWYHGPSPRLGNLDSMTVHL